MKNFLIFKGTLFGRDQQKYTSRFNLKHKIWQFCTKLYAF